MICICLLIAGGLLAGCETERLSQPQSNRLQAGYEALNAHQPSQAIEQADAFLKTSSTGLGSAEAYYLRGRGYEQKTAATPEDARKNLRLARSSYEDALNHDPSPAVEGDIRASLSNVAFMLDDYPTTLDEASRAYNLVDSADVQSVLLYRMAVSQQRMGRFTDADHTFALVQSRYPNSTVAQRSKEQQGQRNFYVQLATYTSDAGAQRQMASLQSTGMLLSKHSDSAGHTVIDAGPYSSYGEAQQAKQRFADNFPDALIKP